MIDSLKSCNVDLILILYTSNFFIILFKNIIFFQSNSIQLYFRGILINHSLEIVNVFNYYITYLQIILKKERFMKEQFYITKADLLIKIAIESDHFMIHDFSIISPSVDLELRLMYQNITVMECKLIYRNTFIRTINLPSYCYLYA